MIDSKKKAEALDLLNKASDILSEADLDMDDSPENIHCPLGEVISNVEGLDVE